jgi:hypothetical protein
LLSNQSVAQIHHWQHKPLSCAFPPVSLPRRSRAPVGKLCLKSAEPCISHYDQAAGDPERLDMVPLAMGNRQRYRLSKGYIIYSKASGRYFATDFDC